MKASGGLTAPDTRMLDYIMEETGGVSMDTYNFFAPTQVLFGPGMLNHLHEVPMPGKTAMVVISNGKSTRATGTLDRVLAQLTMAGCQAHVFDKVSANPLKATVEEGARFARAHACDFVVAVGGGSVMDAGKNMALLAPQPSDDLWDYAGGITGKRKVPENPSLPWIAVTTTAGTGSEVDAGGVVTKPETNEKIGIGAADLFAVYAIVDPELMRTVPPKFTAYQGFDTLFHCTEGYICRVANPMSRMVQRTAIENVGKYLARAVANGDDMEARTGMAFANTLGGYSMVASSCTSEHSLEHALSAYHPDLPHGAGLIMISLAYYKFFIDTHTCDQAFTDMARFLGKADADKPEDFLTALKDLQTACGVADLKMTDYGITEDEFRDMAHNAFTAMGALFNVDPAPMSEDDAVYIFRQSLK